MKRIYAKEFHFAGLSRLDHCEGPDWDEVWADPTWETKPMTAHRANFIWLAIQRECREILPAYKPTFKAGRKYILSITQDDSSGKYPHILYAHKA